MLGSGLGPDKQQRGKSDITFTAVALLAISRTEEKAGGENRGHNRLSLEAKTEVVKVSIRSFIRPLKLWKWPKQFLCRKSSGVLRPAVAWPVRRSTPWRSLAARLAPHHSPARTRRSRISPGGAVAAPRAPRTSQPDPFPRLCQKSLSAFFGVVVILFAELYVPVRVPAVLITLQRPTEVLLPRHQIAVRVPAAALRLFGASVQPCAGNALVHTLAPAVMPPGTPLGKSILLNLVQLFLR